MALLHRAAVMALLVVVVSTCGTDDDTPGASSTTTAASSPTSEPTSSSSTPTTNDTDPDEAAARAFVDAWRNGDAETMRKVGDDDAVDPALALGTAAGQPDCRSQPNGQYQCVVDVSSGTRAYLLVGEPGATEGRVWWVAEYVPGA
jgi:hypothetical protein